MSRDIATADTQTSIRDVAKKMAQTKQDSIIIVENNIPIGIVTYKDFVKKNIVDANSVDFPIVKIMSSPLIHCRPEQSIWEVMDLMYARGIKIIPIIDEYDELLGMVNLLDIIKALPP